MSRKTSSHRHRLASVTVALAALAAFVLAQPAEAELVVFTNGHFLHVDSYRVEGDTARLELRRGGVMTLSMARVARVIDDRRVEDPEPVVIEAGFDLRWRDDQAQPDVPFGDLIHWAAQRHGLNPQLVAAVAKAESAYRADAVSPKGARGLMQLMPATADRFDVPIDHIHDPRLNLDAGARYLRILADRYDDDLRLVLAAYNAGEGTVARYQGVPPYRETRGYLQRIFSYLGIDELGIDESA